MRWYCCCIFRFCWPFLLLFFLPFLSLSAHSSRRLMNVMTKTFILNIIDSSHRPTEKARPIDRPGGIDVSSLCTQTSSNEQRPVITAFKEALCSDHSQNAARSPSNSPLLSSSWLSPQRCCDEADLIIKQTVTRYLSFRFKRFHCGPAN